MFHFALMIILSIVAVFGTLGNILIIGAVCLQKRMRNTGNVFIVNLAVADLIITAYIMPLGIAQSQFEHRLYGDFLCELNAFLVLTTCGVSTQSLMMVAGERYLHICRPGLYNKIFKTFAVAALVVFTWVYTMAWTIHGWTGWTQFAYGKDIYVCVFNGPYSLSYDICLAFFGMMLPMIVLSVCYFCIFRTVRASRRALNAHKSPSKSEMSQDGGDTGLVTHSEKSVKKESRLVATLFTIVILFIIFWTPAAVVLVLSSLWEGMPKVFYPISVWVALCNSCVNCIVYGAMNKNFQQGYKMILMNLFCCRSRDKRCACVSKDSSDGESNSKSASRNSPRKSSSGTATDRTLTPPTTLERPISLEEDLDLTLEDDKKTTL